MPELRFNPRLRLGTKSGQALLWDARRQQPMTVPKASLQAWTRGLRQGDWSHLGDTERASLRAHGVLVDSPGDRPAALALAEAAPAMLPASLELSAQLCLLAGEHGWIAWSSSLGEYVALPDTLAVELLCAGDRLTAADWSSHLGVPSGRIAQLLELGLLRRAVAAPGNPGGLAQQQAVALGSGDPFAGHQPDARMPVYFVTHHVDHLPLALGMLRAALMAHRDGELLRHYQPLPIVSLDASGMQALYRRFGPGIWLFSNYMWSHEYNRGLSAAVKAADPRNLTIHGGPSAPKYELACRQYMQANAHVDVVVRGEGESTLCDLLGTLAGTLGWGGLDGVAGITFFRDLERRDLVRTPERPRMADVDALPSPYLDGCFDHYGGQVIAAILETNRGCPFACTFCDWGSATAAKIRRFDLQRVKHEIDWIGRQRIRVLWIADANFGIFPRDIEIAEYIAATKARHGFPREVVVNYPKNATDKIAEIVRIFAKAGICGQGIISIQTTDPTTLAVIRRDNIKTRKYDELGEIFRRENLPLSTDLMIGLPGATVQSFKADLQYYFDDDVGVKAYRTQLLPNSPMADPDYVREHQIKVDAGNYLISTRSYSEAELGEMLSIWAAFDLADGYSLLRYALRYLQWDHGLVATETLHALVQAVRADPERYPLLTWMLRHFLQQRRVLEGWGPFYREFARFVSDRFGIGASTGWDCILGIGPLLMPQSGRRFPERHRLGFDVVGYFNDHLRAKGQRHRPLRDYPPGEIEISDPFRMCELDYGAIEQYDNHQVFFELASDISRRRSAPNFVDAAQVA